MLEIINNIYVFDIHIEKIILFLIKCWRVSGKVTTLQAAISGAGVGQAARPTRLGSAATTISVTRPTSHRAGIPFTIPTPRQFS